MEPEKPKTLSLGKLWGGGHLVGPGVEEALKTREGAGCPRVTGTGMCPEGNIIV